MSEQRFEPFHPPVEFTDMEWRILEALRVARAVDGAAVRVGLTDAQMRQALKLLADKLRTAATV